MRKLLPQSIKYKSHHTKELWRLAYSGKYDNVNTYINDKKDAKNYRDELTKIFIYIVFSVAKGKTALNSKTTETWEVLKKLYSLGANIESNKIILKKKDISFYLRSILKKTEKGIKNAISEDKKRAFFDYLYLLQDFNKIFKNMKIDLENIWSYAIEKNIDFAGAIVNEFPEIYLIKKVKEHYTALQFGKGKMFLTCPNRYGIKYEKKIHDTFSLASFSKIKVFKITIIGAGIYNQNVSEQYSPEFRKILAGIEQFSKQNKKKIFQLKIVDIYKEVLEIIKKDSLKRNKNKKIEISFEHSDGHAFLQSGRFKAHLVWGINSLIYSYYKPKAKKELKLPDNFPLTLFSNGFDYKAKFAIMITENKMYQLLFNQSCWEKTKVGERFVDISTSFRAVSSIINNKDENKPNALWYIAIKPISPNNNYYKALGK
ncbi:hypothetical protein ACFLZV_06165 [Candidatus Margulisiibacteriota bacterium]